MKRLETAYKVLRSYTIEEFHNIYARMEGFQKGQDINEQRQDDMEFRQTVAL